MSSFLRSAQLNEDTIPLWNIGGTFLDHDREYFNVQVYSDENYIEQDKDMNDILNMNEYKCHICDINVPKSYTEDHMKSVKHITCKKIASIALERTQSYMKSETMGARQKIQIDETYFCEHCTVVVQNIDKERHIKTTQHLNSAKNDKLLQNLVKIYEERNYIDIGNISAKDVVPMNFVDILSTKVEEINDDAHDNASIKYNVKKEEKEALKHPKNLSDNNLVKIYEDPNYIDNISAKDVVPMNSVDVLSTKVEEIYDDASIKNNVKKEEKEALKHPENLSDNNLVKIYKDPNYIDNISAKDVVPMNSVDVLSTKVEEIYDDASIKNNVKKEEKEALKHPENLSDNNLVKIYEDPNYIDNISAKDVVPMNVVDIISKKEGEINDDANANVSIENNVKKEEREALIHPNNLSDNNSEINDKKVNPDENQTKLNSSNSFGKISVSANAKTEKLNNNEIEELYVQETTVRNNKDMGNAKNKLEPSTVGEEPSDNVLENNLKTTSTLEKVSSEESKFKIKEAPRTINVPNAASTSQTTSAIASKINYVGDIENFKFLCELFLTTTAIKVIPYSEDLVTVSVSGLEKVRIPVENLFGYSIEGEKVKCKICSKSMNHLAGKKHMWSEKHTDKVMLPVKEYLRKISDILYHCILCNSLHSDSQMPSHPGSSEHIKNLQNYIIAKEISEKMKEFAINNGIKRTKNMMRCKICDILLARTNHSIHKHVHSSDHQSKLK